MKRFWAKLFASKPSAPVEASRLRAGQVQSLASAGAAPTVGSNPADGVASALLDAAIVDGSIRDPSYVYAPSDVAPDDMSAGVIRSMEQAGRRDIADQIRKYGYRRMRFALTARDTFSGVALDAVSPIQAGRATDVIARAAATPLAAWKASSAAEHSVFLRHALEQAAGWCASVGQQSQAAFLLALIRELQLEAQVFPGGALWGPGQPTTSETAGTPAAVPPAQGTRESGGGRVTSLPEIYVVFAELDPSTGTQIAFLPTISGLDSSHTIENLRTLLGNLSRAKNILNVDASNFDSAEYWSADGVLLSLDSPLAARATDPALVVVRWKVQGAAPAVSASDRQSLARAIIEHARANDPNYGRFLERKRAAIELQT